MSSFVPMSAPNNRNRFRKDEELRLLSILDPRYAPKQDPAAAGSAIPQIIQPLVTKRTAAAAHHTKAMAYECARARFNSNPHRWQNTRLLKSVFPDPQIA